MGIQTRVTKGDSLSDNSTFFVRRDDTYRIYVAIPKPLKNLG